MPRLIIFMMFFALMAWVTPVSAEPSSELMAGSSTANPRCRLIETANFGINFGNMTLDSSAASSYVSERIAEIQALAKEVGLSELEINSMNYNLNSIQNNYTAIAGSTATAVPPMQLSGNITFILTDVPKGMELLGKANQKGFYVNFSLNAYRQCN